jgi:hypothetical protein
MTRKKTRMIIINKTIFISIIHIKICSRFYKYSIKKKTYLLIIKEILPRINLFKYGSRLHVHGRNCFRSITFKTGSLCCIASSNLRPLRSSSNRGSLFIGINGLILKRKLSKIYIETKDYLL